MSPTRYRASGPQAEFQPGSRGRVLCNLKGIVRVREMQRAESEALLATHEWAIAHFTASQRLTAHDVVRLHRHWLGGLYPWAGEFRQVNVSKGGFMFAAATRVPQLMRNFGIRDLARMTPCSGMDRERLAKALARTHAELVLIHPFREGNGRCARLLAWLMALQAGMPPLDFSPLSGRGRPAYFAAIRSALSDDYAPLEACFNRVLARTLRVTGSAGA